MPRLTPREREVLELYVEFGNIDAVAEELQIASQTVKNLLYDARKRNGVRKTGQLLYMLALGEFDDR